MKTENVKTLHMDPEKFVLIVAWATILKSSSITENQNSILKQKEKEKYLNILSVTYRPSKQRRHVVYVYKWMFLFHATYWMIYYPQIKKKTSKIF